jgi:hypothetical protein
MLLIVILDEKIELLINKNNASFGAKLIRFLITKINCPIVMSRGTKYLCLSISGQ